MAFMATRISIDKKGRIVLPKSLQKIARRTRRQFARRSRRRPCQLASHPPGSPSECLLFTFRLV